MGTGSARLAQALAPDLKRRTAGPILGKPKLDGRDLGKLRLLSRGLPGDIPPRVGADKWFMSP